MATLSDLRSAVDTILGIHSIGSVLQLNSNTRERAFEAYVFALVVESVRSAGGTAELRGSKTGANPSAVIFRGAPGNMGSTTQDFCYASCTLGQKKFEIHVDVIYVGSSGANHEVDVSIYEESAAMLVRSKKHLPKTYKLRGAFECKCYDSNLGTALGRTFVGLVADCGQLRMKAFVTNGRSTGLALYFSNVGRPDRFFDVSPLRQDKAELFKKTVENELRKWANVT